MKKYLVTEEQLGRIQYEVDAGYGYGNDDEAPTAAEIREAEIPPNARVLTRDQVTEAILKHRAGPVEKAADELFGKASE